MFEFWAFGTDNHCGFGVGLWDRLYDGRACSRRDVGLFSCFLIFFSRVGGVVTWGF